MKAARVDSFVNTFSDGFDTVLEEDGANLSAGQRQLLTIARTILSKKEVLILDEATSSVDTRTEKLIQKAMDMLMENRTSFIIAHRLSTIRNADKIIVIRNIQAMLKTGSAIMMSEFLHHIHLFIIQQILDVSIIFFCFIGFFYIKF